MTWDSLTHQPNHDDMIACMLARKLSDASIASDDRGRACDRMNRRMRSFCRALLAAC
jgi:hypothetical protein